MPTACYKDLSTEATWTIGDISIEGVDESITVVYGDNISISPSVFQEGNEEADFSYLWEMDLVPNNEDSRIELSEEKSLDMKVVNSPSDNPYILSFKVTDNKTGVAAYASCKLYVVSAMGEGLLVAHTRDGGQTSEFDMAKNPAVTFGYTGDARYSRNLFETANGYVLQGKVQAIASIVDSQNNALDESRIIVGTDSHIMALDPLTFIKKETDAELFYNCKETTFNTTDLFNWAAYITSAIINGRLYSMMTIIDRCYSKVTYSHLPNDIFSSRNVGYAKMDQGSILTFDTNTGKFSTLRGWQSLGGGLAETTASIDFDALGGTAMAGGCSRDSKPAMLIKDSGGVFHICVWNFSSNVDAVKCYTIDSPDIASAEHFTFCDNCDLMYYTVGNEINVAIMTGSGLTYRKVAWAPESADEEITDIRQYMQGWYGTHQYFWGDYEFVLPTNRSQLMITTYNRKSGEGKIYLRGFNINTGLFTASGNNGVFSGFGEITAVAPTFR